MTPLLSCITIHAIPVLKKGPSAIAHGKPDQGYSVAAAPAPAPAATGFSLGLPARRFFSTTAGSGVAAGAASFPACRPCLIRALTLQAMPGNSKQRTSIKAH